MPDKLKALLTSRKFWAALIGLAVVLVKVFRPDFPFTAEQITAVVVIVVSYILGTAIEDGLSYFGGAHTAKQREAELIARFTLAHSQPK